MALIQGTIAATGADFVSLAEAEASIPSTSADDFEFTYIEALQDTAGVTFSATSFTGSVLVDVLEAFRCKGAVSGSHAQLKLSAGAGAVALRTIIANVTIRNLRIIRDGSVGAGARAVLIDATSTGVVFDKCVIIRDCTSAAEAVFQSESDSSTLMNSFVIGRNMLSGTHPVIQSRANLKIYRCCVFLESGSAFAIIRTVLSGTVTDCRQVLAIKAAGATAVNGAFFADVSGTFNAASDANGATDESAPGTNPNDNLDPAAAFAVLTQGSENMHYPTRAAMLALAAGADLRATTGALDIDGDTIAEWYPGADYVLAVAAGGSGGRNDGLGPGLGLGP